MTAPSLSAIRELIRTLHGCGSRHVEMIEVRVPAKGRPLWSGPVHVFELDGWLAGTRCYAWARQPGKRGPRNIAVVLHKGRVGSPRAAVLHDLGRG